MGSFLSNVHVITGIRFYRSADMHFYTCTYAFFFVYCMLFCKSIMLWKHSMSYVSINTNLLIYIKLFVFLSISTVFFCYMPLNWICNRNGHYTSVCLFICRLDPYFHTVSNLSLRNLSFCIIWKKTKQMDSPSRHDSNWFASRSHMCSSEHSCFHEPSSQQLAGEIQLIQLVDL